MLSRLRPSLVVIGIGLALVACVSKKNSSGGGTLTVPDEDPVRIEVLPSSPSAENGATVQLGVQAVYSNGAVEYIGATGTRGEVTWTSANAAIATVDADGIATGKAVGNVAITAAYGNKSAEKTLNITPKVTAIQVFPPTVSVETKASADYTVVALYEDHTAAQVTPEGFAIENGTFATVSSSTVEGVAEGTTTMTVTYHQRSTTAPVEVLPATTPATVTGITLTGPSQLAQGTTGKFKATATYSDATTANVTADVTWSSSDAEVLTVENAVATSVAAGTANVQASLTVEGVATPFTAEKAVQVMGDSVVLQSVDLVPAFAGLAVLPLDVTTSFTAMGHFAGGYDQDITRDATWKVVNADASDEGVHAGPGAKPGQITTSTDTVDIGFSAGDVVVTAELGDVKSAKYPLTIAGFLDKIEITSDTASPVVGDEPLFTATGHYKDGTTDLAFTFDLSARVAWFDSQTQAGLPPSLVVDNTPGDEGQGFAVRAGTEDVIAYYHALVPDDTGTLQPFEKTEALSVTVAPAP